MVEQLAFNQLVDGFESLASHQVLGYSQDTNIRQNCWHK